MLFDVHLDLAMNAMEWNRDLSRPIDEIRNRERHLTDKPDRGRGPVVPGVRRGGVGSASDPDCALRAPATASRVAPPEQRGR